MISRCLFVVRLLIDKQAVVASSIQLMWREKLAPVARRRDGCLPISPRLDPNRTDSSPFLATRPAAAFGEGAG